MTRLRSTPFMERHPLLSLAALLAALLVIAVAVGTGVGVVGANLVDALAPG